LNTQQAQQIIKTVLDQAIKAGVLHNIDAAATVAQAWTIILETLNKSNVNER